MKSLCNSEAAKRRWRVLDSQQVHGFYLDQEKILIIHFDQHQIELISLMDQAQRTNTHSSKDT